MATVSGYIIERYDNMCGAYTCNRLREEAAKLGMDVRIIGMQDTYLSDGKVFSRGEPLKEADFSIIRHRACAVRDAVCGLSGRTYNDRGLFDRYISKAGQVRDVRSDLMRIPGNIVSTSVMGFGRIADMLGVPFVMKGLEGSRGDQIHLISDEHEYEALRRSEGPSKEWLFEEFVSESRGRDLRLYSVRGRPVACMMRRNDSDFRANFALGAVLSPVDITPELEGIAEDVYRSTGLDVAGIDLLLGRDGYCFCEVNVMPGIKGIEETTGVNIAGAVMGMVSEDLHAQRRG